MTRNLPALLLAALAATPAAAASPVEGDWLVEDRTAIITIAPCGPTLCGRITRILKAGPNRTDIKNPDAKLRNRPFQGLTIISGMSGGGGAWSGGRIYDPTSGKTYKSKLALNGDGSLKVSGCVAFFCQDQRWTRPR